MKKILKLLLIVLLILSFTSITYAEMAVKDNPVWSESELGVKPDFSKYNDETVEIDLWTFSAGLISMLDPLATEFETLYPEVNLKINIQQLPFQQMFDSLTTSLIAGNGAPDIVSMEIGQTAKFFSPPFESNFGEIDLNDDMKEDLIKQAPYMGTNGKLLGVESAGPHPSFLFYRKDLFNEAGIEMPLDTWEDFIDAGLKMKEEIGVPITLFPITNITWGSWMQLNLIVQNGNPIYNEKGEFILNNEKSVEALEMVKDMVYEYEIAVDAEPDDPLTQQRLVGKHPDQIASVVAPLWFPGSRLFNKIENPVWGIAPMPKFKDAEYRTSSWGGTSLSVVESQSDYPEIAEAFVKYCIAYENQIRKFEEINYLPVLKSALKSDEVKNYTNPEVYGDQKVGEIYAKYTQELAPFRFGEGWASTSQEIGNRMNELKDMDSKEWLEMIENYQQNL